MAVESDKQNLESGSMNKNPQLLNRIRRKNFSLAMVDPLHARACDIVAGSNLVQYYVPSRNHILISD